MADQTGDPDVRTPRDERDATASAARIRIAELEGELRRQSRSVGYFRAVAAQREVELGMTRAELKHLHETVIPARDADIQTLTAQIERLTADVDALHTVHIAHRDQVIAGLQAEIRHIHSSLTWQITRPLRSMWRLLSGRR